MRKKVPVFLHLSVETASRVRDAASATGLAASAIVESALLSKLGQMAEAFGGEFPPRQSVHLPGGRMPADGIRRPQKQERRRGGAFLSSTSSSAVHRLGSGDSAIPEDYNTSIITEIAQQAQAKPDFALGRSRFATAISRPPDDIPKRHPGGASP